MHEQFAGNPVTDTGTLHTYTETVNELADICRALFDGLDTPIAFEPIGLRLVEAAGFCLILQSCRARLPARQVVGWAPSVA